MGRIAIDDQLEGPRMEKCIDADTTKPPLNARTAPTLLICLVTGTNDTAGNVIEESSGRTYALNVKRAARGWE